EREPLGQGRRGMALGALAAEVHAHRPDPGVEHADLTEQGDDGDTEDDHRDPQRHVGRDPDAAGHAISPGRWVAKTAPMSRRSWARATMTVPMTRPADTSTTASNVGITGTGAARAVPASARR